MDRLRAASPLELFAALDRLGIAHHSVSHPPLFTVAQSQALRGMIPGGHTKNLLLRDKRGPVFLVVALEEAVIDLKTLHLRLGAARLSFASPGLVRDLLGVEPGSVTPFGLINDQAQLVTAILDAEMMRLPRLNFHPLVNTMTTSLASEDLCRFLAAIDHPPRVVAVARDSPGARAEP